MEAGDVIFQNNVPDPLLAEKNADLKFQLEKSRATSQDVA